jgi:RNA polymerase sigma factor (sigma-70 family)
MAEGATTDVLRQVGRLFGEGTIAGLTDRQLLERFRSRQDATAFEAIVARHGPMVLGVCRDVLRNPADADDAFQAAFLVLLRRVGSIRGRDGVGGWLYRVSYRIALRARRAATRRAVGPASPEPLAPEDPPAEVAIRELRHLIRRELDRLPETYRAPIVLCDLEGLTHDEAAVRLSWPVGTVKGRLSRGREKLRDRLIRRGVAAPAAFVGAALSTETGRAAVPDALIRSTVALAVGMRTPGVVPASVACLVTGAVNAMLGNKIAQVGSGAAVLAALAGGVAALGMGQDRPGPGAATPVAEIAPASKPLQPADEALDLPVAARPTEHRHPDLLAMQGVWRLMETERGGRVERVNPRLQPAEAIVIAGDYLTRALLAEGGPPSYDGTMLRITLQPEATPKGIDFKTEGVGPDSSVASRGIYRLDGDFLTICASGRGLPRPTSFTTELGRAERRRYRRVVLPPEYPVVGHETFAEDAFEVGAEGKDSKPQQDGAVQTAIERAAIDLEELELEAEKRALSKLLDDRADQEEALQSNPRDEVALRSIKAALNRLGRQINERKSRYVQRNAKLAERKRRLADSTRTGGTGPGPVPLAPPRAIVPGDLLVIEVLEALPGRPITGRRIVRPDGTISLEFYGDLPVAGLNRTQIKEKLIQHLRRFLTDEAMGLVDEDPMTGEERPIPPAESDRIFVDDSLNFLGATDRDAAVGEGLAPRRRAPDRMQSVEMKLDAILHRLNQIEAQR